MPRRRTTEQKRDTYILMGENGYCDEYETEVEALSGAEDYASEGYSELSIYKKVYVLKSKVEITKTYVG